MPAHMPEQDLDAYWALSPAALLAALKSGRHGLAAAEAGKRRRDFGPNTFAEKGRSRIFLLLAQFRSPLVLILIFAAAVSGFVGDLSEAAIITTIVLASSLMTFFQEFSASTAVEKLKARIAARASVVRDGRSQSLPASDIVPGDIVELAAGNLVPADGVVLEANDLHVSEAALTGEPFPVQKDTVPSAAGATLAGRTNMVFMGTAVRSGSGRVLIVRTGGATEYGAIAATLARRPPETDFERGVRRFGYLMTEVMLVIVILVFFANLLLARPLIDSLLFALALAVGLTPELLPTIISIALSRGARKLARSGVIVRRLASLESLGSMNVLCTDKTGTLTLGVAGLAAALDTDGKPSAEVLHLAALNAAFQTGLPSPLDDAIRALPEAAPEKLSPFQKRGEIPYDFERKRLSVIVGDKDSASQRLVCKGAVASMLDAATSVIDAKGKTKPVDGAARAGVIRKLDQWSANGHRVLAIAVRSIERKERYGVKDETGLTLCGFLLFTDPPKPGIAKTLEAIAHRGVGLKIITGDNRFVAAHLAETVGIKSRHLLTGSEIARLGDAALAAAAPRTDLFVEVDPNQKERIIAALKRAGNVVGYLGDGINDAPALQAADVGISVESAVDVAREAADIVLMQHDLDVLIEGIDGGRVTFANTLKYISITTSANFGNMVSMAVASLALPFLPLLAKQVLLNNFLSDFPALAMAGDNVDADLVRGPRRWDVGEIRRFMIGFGLISSLFDALTFGFLLYVVHAGPALFRTGWFIESLMTELMIALVIRTRRPFYQSRPGKLLFWSTLAMAAITVAIPYLPGADLMGFEPLDAATLVGLLTITGLYVLATEIAKRGFHKWRHRRA